MLRYIIISTEVLGSSKNQLTTNHATATAETSYIIIRQQDYIHQCFKRDVILL